MTVQCEFFAAARADDVLTPWHAAECGAQASSSWSHVEFYVPPMVPPQHGGSSGDHTSADEPRALLTLSPSATCERRGETSPRERHCKRSFWKNPVGRGCAGIVCQRARTCARAVSRAAGREYPIGHLLCDFEVGLSLKSAHEADKTKPVAFGKKLPVKESRPLGKSKIAV